MKPKTAEKLIKITGELYEKEAQSFSNIRSEIWEKEIIEFVSKIEPRSSILDLGCGNGRLFDKISNIKNQKSKLQSNNEKIDMQIYSNVLQNCRIDYIGIDPSKEFIKLNKEKYPDANFEVGDGLKINYKDRFDYIISIAVLHHIPSEGLQLKFLKNVYNALKPGGKTLISVWNRLHEKYQKLQAQSLKLKAQNYSLKLITNDLDVNDHIVPWRQSGLFRFIHTFEPKELKSLAQKAGFKNIEILVSKHGIETNIKTALNIYLIATKKKE